MYNFTYKLQIKYELRMQIFISSISYMCGNSYIDLCGNSYIDMCGNSYIDAFNP